MPTCLLFCLTTFFDHTPRLCNLIQAIHEKGVSKYMYDQIFLIESNPPDKCCLHCSVCVGGDSEFFNVQPKHLRRE